MRQIPPEKNIGAMMLSGELDAVMYYLVDPNLIDRSTADLRNHPDIKPLFPDPWAEGVRYYQKTGLYPMDGTVATNSASVQPTTASSHRFSP